VGYDDHIAEYFPFFYDRSEWAGLNYESRLESLDDAESLRSNPELGAKEKLELSAVKYPLPKDPNHPYYQEKACAIIEALETGVPTYLDSSVIVGRGAVENLPFDAVLDIPSVVAGGEVRPVHVGKLPAAAAEICRRQISIHELAVEAAMTGDKAVLLQALALDSYIRSLRQARGIMDDFLEFYSGDLPQFKN
jgi:alpha-galactosidase